MRARNFSYINSGLKYRLHISTNTITNLSYTNCKNYVAAWERKSQLILENIKYWNLCRVFSVITQTIIENLRFSLWVQESRHYDAIASSILIILPCNLFVNDDKKGCTGVLHSVLALVWIGALLVLHHWLTSTIWTINY